MRFVEKPGWDEVTTNMINAGIYVLERQVLERIPAAKKSMFEHDIFPSLLEEGQPITGYPSEAYWIDIGTPEKYLKAHHDLLSKMGDTYVKVDETSRVDPRARIEGPVIIGKNSSVAGDVRIKGPAVLGAGCAIDAGADIAGSVLWDDVDVGKEAKLVDSVVATGCHIQDRCHIPAGCVLGDDVTLKAGYELPGGSSIEPDTVLG
jgi:mannose-1-phosphate guanylyltransferase